MNEYKHNLSVVSLYIQKDWSDRSHYESGIVKMVISAFNVILKCSKKLNFLLCLFDLINFVIAILVTHA